MDNSAIMSDEKQILDSEFEPTQNAHRQISLIQFHAIEINTDPERYFLNEIPINKLTIIGFVKKCTQISKGLSLEVTDGTSTVNVLYFPQSSNNKSSSGNNMGNTFFEEGSLIKIMGKLSNTNDKRVFLARTIIICKDFNLLTLQLVESLVINKFLQNENIKENESTFTDLEQKILKFIKANRITLKDDLIEHLNIDYTKTIIEKSVDKLVKEKFINLDDEDGTLTTGD
ncbi:hypothetical protein CDIK_1571 [Cucumispora dikerogammari]|nr:hypothetical protein CDIK_1571 [Cucumispora dikerogammari]